MRTSTTEARRHGERSSDLVITRDRVIGVAAGSDQVVMFEHTIDLCHPERVGADATASRRPPTMSVPRTAASGSSYETTNLTAETRRRGENLQKSATEARRHGESHRNSIFRDHRITRSLLVLAAFKKMVLVIRATLREIFDESAYDRFLRRTHASRSVASYRAFMRERDAAMLKKPRCC